MLFFYESNGHSSGLSNRGCLPFCGTSMPHRRNDPVLCIPEPNGVNPMYVMYIGTISGD